MPGTSDSHRARQTLDWIRRAFHNLMWKRRYSDIHVNDIVRKAGVGRSTFYDHFKSKDQLLEQGLATVLNVLADAATPGADITAIERALAHFWEVRDRIKDLSHGPNEPIVVRVFADLFEERLNLICQDRRVVLSIPRRLAAIQLAGAQLALICAWLEGQNHCTTETIARALQYTSTSMVDALLVKGTTTGSSTQPA